MTTEFFTLRTGQPAIQWGYAGDGEWYAIAGERLPTPRKARHLKQLLPIDQLPADGVIIFATDKGVPITQRVERGKAT